jgi:hypothetical protein
MPTGSSHHFDGLADGQGNLDDANLNSLDAGGNVWPVASALQVNVEPAVFNSSALVNEVYAGATAQPVTASTTNYVYLLPGGPPTLVINAVGFPVAEHCPLAEVDTDTIQVIAIRDARPKLSSLVGSGPPSGPAGPTKLSGTYPDPGFAAGAIVDADVNAGAAIVESKLALNFATHSNANDPGAGEKAALAGTAGVPGGGNEYVTNTDARMTDARTPALHAASHQHSGADEVATATPAANAIPKADGFGKLDSWVTLQAYGQNQALASGPARTTTVSGVPVLKVQVILPAILGTVRLRWTCDVDNAGAANAGTVRLYNVTDAGLLDSHVYGQAAIPATDAKHVTGVVDFVLAGAAKTIELQHWDNVGGNTQGIARATIEVKRVA